MARRKRIEAWAKFNRDGELWGYCRSRGVLEANYNDLKEDEYPTVRLVECGPDEVVLPKSAAAVVRAAIAVVEGYSEKRLGKPARYAELKRAVERQKGRKK